MQTRPTYRPPQTTTQAKAEYKKYGPRVSSQEARQLERGAELYRRAEKIKENEKRRRAALKRRQEKEQKELEARRRMDVPSQRTSVSGSQGLLEGFVRITKPGQDVGLAQGKLEETKTEPWGEDDLDDVSLLDAVVLPDTNLTFEDATQGVALEKMSTDLGMDDGWDDFLLSNTQIEREITVQPARPTEPCIPCDPFFAFLSTQDVTFSPDNLEELGVCKKPEINAAPTLTLAMSPKKRDRILMPPPRMPWKVVSAPVSVPAVQPTGVPEFLPDDFELSTQDFREIGG